jgi:hypothetical protein
LGWHSWDEIENIVNARELEAIELLERKRTAETDKLSVVGTQKNRKRKVLTLKEIVLQEVSTKIDKTETA